MKKNIKQLAVWATITLVVVLITSAVIIVASKNVIDQTANAPKSIQNTTPEPDSAKNTAGNKTTSGSSIINTTISYGEAVTKYADRRIQLDTMCQAHPNTITYKDNTGIMIDNRSPNTRTVKVGTTFTIKPYGFKIVVLPDVYLKAKTLLVDCDGSQNVATILVQE